MSRLGGAKLVSWTAHSSLPFARRLEGNFRVTHPFRCNLFLLDHHCRHVSLTATSRQLSLLEIAEEQAALSTG